MRQIAITRFVCFFKIGLLGILCFSCQTEEQPELQLNLSTSDSADHSSKPEPSTEQTVKPGTSDSDSESDQTSHVDSETTSQEEQDTTPSDVDSDTTTINPPDTTPFEIVSRYPDVEATDIPISDDVVITFSKPVDPSTINSATFQIVEANTSAPINCRVELQGDKVTIDPILQLVPFPDMMAARNTSVKQATTYRVLISTDIRDNNGDHLSEGPFEWSFTTADLDFGFYWCNGKGECEKADSKKNRFYDPNKPIVIHTHGWLPSIGEDDYIWREIPYAFTTRHVDRNLGELWESKGYNLGFLYWAQFANEDEVKDAEVKVWKDNKKDKKLWYRLLNKKYKPFSTDKNIHELLYDAYVQAVKGNKSNEIRFVGHSLGNQVVIALAYQVLSHIKAGDIEQNLMPNRLALLEPFWSKGSKEYLENKTNVEVCTEYIKEMIQYSHIAVEFYRTTPIGIELGFEKGIALVGDDAEEIRRMSMLCRIKPYFIKNESGDLWLYGRETHTYSISWYYWSMEFDLQVGGTSYIGASASYNQIRDAMNDESKELHHFNHTNGGQNTAKPQDDRFSKKAGIDMDLF